MSPHKFSAIAHNTHTLCNPISDAKFDALLDVLPLSAASRAVDFGCGNSEMLIRLIERFGLHADGVDRSGPMIAAARARAEERGVADRLHLHQMGAQNFTAAEGSHDLVLAVGAAQLFDGVKGVEATLRRLASLVRPGGHLLFGEGYWRIPPSPEYLAALGAEPSDYHDHAGNVFAGEAAGLVPMHAVVASEDDWDAYEWRYSRSIERYAIEHPEDPDVPAMRERIRNWRRIVLTGGRQILGFGLYLFYRPNTAQENRPM